MADKNLTMEEATERDIQNYRAQGCELYFQPDEDNARWFMELMFKYDIRPANENPCTPGVLSVLMVNL